MGFVKQDLTLSAAAARALVAARATGKALGFCAAGRAVDSIGGARCSLAGNTALGLLIVPAALAPLSGLVLGVHDGRGLRRDAGAGGAESSVILLSFPRAAYERAAGRPRRRLPSMWIALAVVIGLALTPALLVREPAVGAAAERLAKAQAAPGAARSSIGRRLHTRARSTRRVRVEQA